MKNKKMVLLIVIASVLLLVICINLYIRLAPQFGCKPKKDSFFEVAINSKYDGKKFYNETETYTILPKSGLKAIKAQFQKYPDRLPLKPLPSVKPFFGKGELQDSLSVIWLGHSSVFIRINNLTILTDPVFSKRASPVPFVGPKPFPISIAFTPEEIPYPDIIILSHDHFDHLDYKTISNYYSGVKRFLVPLGLRDHLQRWGVPAENITEFDWWQSLKLHDSLEIVAVPARHFSGRRGQNNSTLWCSWIIRNETEKIFFCGDSGYGTHFKNIGDKYGPFDLTLMECGAYNNYWPYIHMMPEQTVQAHIDLQGKVLLPIHWGKFNLSFHPWKEPIERLTRHARTDNVSIATPIIGQLLVIGENTSFEQWWEN